MAQVAKKAGKTTPPTKAPSGAPEARPEPSAGTWPSLMSLRQEMDRLFDDFLGMRPGGSRWLEPRSWESLPGVLRGGVPAADVSETDGAYVVRVDLPGVEAKDVEVNVSGDALTVRAEKAGEREEKREDIHFSERYRGTWQRSFRLPQEVDAQRIEARHNNGVLELTLPKSESAKSRQRKIEVQGA
jgi:HSP20 family protein